VGVVLRVVALRIVGSKDDVEYELILASFPRLTIRISYNDFEIAGESFLFINISCQLMTNDLSIRRCSMMQFCALDRPLASKCNGIISSEQLHKSQKKNLPAKIPFVLTQVTLKHQHKCTGKVAVGRPKSSILVLFRRVA